MPGSMHSEPTPSEPEPERRGDAPPVPEEEPSLSGPSASTDPESMARLKSELTSQFQAQWSAREAELTAQFQADMTTRETEMARAMARVPPEAPSTDGLPVVSIDEANAVVQAREAEMAAAAEQAIAARNAELTQTRIQAETERRRLEVEGSAAIFKTRNEVQEARLALQAAEQRNRMMEASARAAVEQEKSQSHLMQRALQEQQGMVSNELSKAAAEQHAIRAENERLQAENVALRSHGPMPVPNPSGLTFGPTGEVSNSMMAQALLEMGQAFKRIAKKGNNSSSAKLPKFESAKVKDEAASLWIERFERVAEDEGWFEEDLDIANKMGLYLDDVGYLWLQTQPPEIRQASAWPAFKAKWKRRFGLSRDMAMAKLITREFGPQ